MHINIRYRVHNNSDDLIRPEITEIKNIFIDEKNRKDLVIYLFSLYFYKLMGKIEEYEEKKYLMVIYFVMNKVLDQIK